MKPVRQWGRKFGNVFSDRIRQHASGLGDKWTLNEVVISIVGEQHRLRVGSGALAITMASFSTFSTS
ncbi:transposase-like protein [Bradyrhizobium sp. USDA 4454]